MRIRSNRLATRLGACASVLVMVLSAACGGDSSGPGPDVASVIVTGAPAGPLLSGGTVQLLATPINASGAVVSNQAVSWESSDADVAKVNGQGMVTAVGAGPAVITAKVRGKEGAVTLDVRVGAMLDGAGGTLSSPNGAVKLVVPAGALGANAILMLRPAVSTPAGTGMLAGTAWELAPQPMGFYNLASLSLRYADTSLPGGTPASTLQLYELSPAGWVLVRGSVVDVASRTVTGGISRAGTYAILSTATDRVVLTGPLADGALYAGQSGTLGVALLSAEGDTLRGRPVTWLSSDPAKATVDGAGKVTALAAGTVTITASNGGKTGATTLSVLTRPVASWTHTADWATFQGNGRHTGEISATLDPGAFKPLWTKTILNGTVLNPVSTGDGKVFVSTNSYFGTGMQKLVVLDARTGTQQWSRDFGAIHSVHPPAYGGGRVYLTTGGHQDSFLWAFDASSGAVQFRSAYGNQWSRWYAPVVSGTTVYMAGGYYGGMYGFNALDGSELWFAQTNQYDEWVPAVADGRVYAFTGSYTPQVSVMDAASGAEVYAIADPEFSWNGWSMNIAPVLGSSNNLLATQGGRLLSFDLANRRVGWTQRSSFTGTTTVSDGTIYVFNNRQVEARRESDGVLQWVWIPPEGEPRGTMVVARNVLFVSTGANTYAIDLSARRHTWSYPAGGQLAVSKDGILLIAQTNGVLAAVDLR